MNQLHRASDEIMKIWADMIAPSDHEAWKASVNDLLMLGAGRTHLRLATQAHAANLGIDPTKALAALDKLTGVGSDVIVFGKELCQRCRTTQDYLHRHGTSYTYIDVETTPGVLDMLKAQGHQGLPVVQTPEETWSGFRPDKLKAIAARSPRPSQVSQAPLPEPSRQLR